MAFCGWRIDGFCCGWRIDGAFCGCFYDELLRGGGARLVEMCCDSCEVAPRGLTGRRQRCGLDEKRSERPTSCMDHRGSRDRRVDFVVLVCYRTLGRLCARRQRELVAQGHIVACCRLEDLRTAAVRELRTDRPRRRLGDTRALQPIKQAARRRRARNEQRDAAAHKTRRNNGSRRGHHRNRVHEARR